MKHTKNITILHSNDMHGDFLAENVDQKLIGGVSMLSGYISKVRKEEKNVIYAISGDMFRGSIIDSEYRGLSTIEIMNILAPDVVTLGNHEVDYGIAHLLFIEKCAKFPIINSNLYITMNHMRLFKSHYIKEIDGMKILFIGILTEEVLSAAKQEKVIGSFIDVHDAAAEIGRICDSYRTEDIDFTVLLTHIGFEEDKRLASILDPNWGVDLIIGGHSHTVLTEPAVVNGIPIVQAASGTDQIGRFDIVVDTDNNCIDSYIWQLIPITSDNCPTDPDLEEVIRKYKDQMDVKYSRVMTRFDKKMLHPRRDRETELGRLFCDILCRQLGLDLMLIGSGSLRNDELGPIVEYRDFMEMYPYGGEVYRVVIDGEQLKRAIRHIFRPESFEGGHFEFYQFSHGIRFVVNCKDRTVTDITFDGEPIADDRLFRIGLQDFHYNNIEAFLGLTKEEAEKYKPAKVVATKDNDILDEYLSGQELVKTPLDARWVTVEG